MGRATGFWKAAAQGAFYLAILALIIGRSVTANISHDENQFIAPAQLLVQQGLFPYVDYPYTHMPYSTPFYALGVWLSQYDLLAGRLLSSLAWFGCILLMLAIARSIRKAGRQDSARSISWWALAWEFLVVYVFVNHGPALFILRTALNHSFATFFALLSMRYLLEGIQKPAFTGRAALLSGASIAIAGLIRFNFAGLAAIPLACWLIYTIWLRKAAWWRLLLAYLAGGLAASLPVIVLAMLAPRQFYYGNLVYIRLNTVYYGQLLHRTGMTLQSKWAMFRGAILVHPLDILLYAVLVLSIAYALVRLFRREATIEVGRLGLAGMAAGLWLSALAPTPGLVHYFAAPYPLLFALLAALGGSELRLAAWPRLAAAAVVVLAAVATDGVRNPFAVYAGLREPSAWPPVQAHKLAMELHEYIPNGSVLSLQSMLPMEGGFDGYGFTATGPFSWRTSLLLTPERRQEYDVISPEELPALLMEQPADGILVGFEAPNAGFVRQDLGGLERPFSEYALAHGYEPVKLSPPFWARGLTLWVRP